MTVVGIIGGTGLGHFDDLEVTEAHSLETPYGDPSHSLGVCRYEGHPVIFLARHGHPGHIPPHLVNYRANIWALKQLGAEEIVSVNSVGAISGALAVEEIVICDQLIDYTYQRAQTYFEDHIQHVDFTHPYHPELRARLSAAAVRASEESPEVRFTVGGVYGCTQGPRLETAAEIERMKRDGCDVVGMTAMPEAVLAAELGIPYASLSLVINPAAGRQPDVIDIAALHGVVAKGMVHVRAVLRQLLSSPE